MYIIRIFNLNIYIIHNDLHWAWQKSTRIQLEIL